MSYIRKGDLIIVTAGGDKGKTGKVLKVLPLKNAVVAEGVNLKKKHRKQRKQEEPGGILAIESPVNLSNVSLYCSKCKKAVKVKIENKKAAKKERVCKKCQGIL